MSISEFPSRLRSESRLRNGRPNQELLAQIRQVRVKPGTVLAVDLLLQERKIDLNAMTEVLSNDPGAMMCVLGMLAEDDSEQSAVSVRIADWISNIDLHELLFELSAHLKRPNDIIEFAHAIAQA